MWNDYFKNGKKFLRSATRARGRRMPADEDNALG
jgi:hypothetical protein